jgi:hypothetical protein
MEGVDDVSGLDGGEGGGAQEQARVVVEEVEDLDGNAGSELPRGGVDLPGLVGKLGLEAEERAPGSLVRLGLDQALALEDAPDAGG